MELLRLECQEIYWVWFNGKETSRCRDRGRRELSGFNRGRLGNAKNSVVSDSAHYSEICSDPVGWCYIDKNGVRCYSDLTDSLFRPKDRLVVTLFWNNEEIASHSFYARSNSWRWEEYEGCLSSFKNSLFNYYCRNVDRLPELKQQKKELADGKEWRKVEDELYKAFDNFIINYQHERINSIIQYGEGYAWGDEDLRIELVKKIRDNKCAFSANIVDKCFEMVNRGKTELSPGHDGIPKYMDLIDKNNGEKYYVRLHKILVFPKSKQKYLELEELTFLHEIGLAVRWKDHDDIIIFAFELYYGYSTRNTDVLYYQSNSAESICSITQRASLPNQEAPGDVFIYDIERCEITGSLRR